MNQHHRLHDTLVPLVTRSWARLWSSKIVGKPLESLRLDPGCIGSLFQAAMTVELQALDPRWSPATAKTDKDFCFPDDRTQDFELKVCGRVGGLEVFGNRCSSAAFSDSHLKNHDGWLLTVNYSHTTINLVRFGYVHKTDWIGQAAATGNSSRLRKEVYLTKLAKMEGDYLRAADSRILRRVGRRLYAAGLVTVGSCADAGHAEALAFLEAAYYR